VPRDLCVLCDAALFNALALNRPAVDPECLDLALGDLSFKGWRGQRAA
jgi:hypothetical protein